ncbi:MAG: UDP-N-acetylmuramoyl-tripeptide--D-alanyl-D-alanine ligase, partial [Eubacteriales bacterium]|nr:UDP-N-acetylmuramoyl-tripeptide--D-alanyl-D-alanine ligase [Eubacteriales bacterium]
MTVDGFRWLLPLYPVCASLLAAKTIYHYFQLESYQFPGYFRSLRRNRVHTWLPGLFVSAVCVLLYYAYDKISASQAPEWLLAAATVALLAAACVLGKLIALLFSEKHAKKKFVLTGRMKRLYGVSFVVMAAASFLIAQSPLAILPALWPLVLPLWVALSGLLAWPVEKAISELYFRDARRKLMNNKGLIRIGITGSYGKTSVKHIIGAILSEKYPTLVTPASFNTPMGVSRAIREKLSPSHQVFVAEMGARHVGDIREMCRLVRPTIGVLTSVGPQHLDTFRTIERVTKTKYELIEALPADSHSYFCDDHAICKQLYDRTEKPKTLISLKAGEADVWSENIAVSPEGCSFDLCIRGKGTIRCQTRLLGEHNILNILTASAVADGLGLTLHQIANGIRKLQPIPSRLELIQSPSSFTVINDAFNANPVGAKAALRVLSQFPERRIIITPGMVELGVHEAE